MTVSLARSMLRRNVRAFLWALRFGEGTQGQDGYRTLVGGKLFKGADGVYATMDDFNDHPRQLITIRFRNGNSVKSTAAGAYQFLMRTWDGVAAKHGFTDFEPTTQDLAAVALIVGRRALEDVAAGRIEQAVKKCNKEWASLPGSPYGQPVVTMKEFLREYEEAGGLYVNEDDLQVIEPPPALPEPKLPALPQLAPVEDRVAVPVAEILARQSEVTTTRITTRATQESNMPIPALVTALAPVLLPSLIRLVPQLAKIFGSGSDVSNRNIEAVTTVFNVAKEAIGAKNEQELMEAIEADPEQAALVRVAIESNFLRIEEVGGGIEAARVAAVQMATMVDTSGAAIPLHKQPAFIISILLLIPVVLTIGLVLFPWELLENGQQIYSDEMRLIVITALITGVLASLVSFWLGTTFTSKGKDQTISAQARAIERQS